MRTITSMKMINCNGWAPCNKLWGAPRIPITNPLIANHNSLYDNFYVRGVAWVYYNLSEPTITYHYFYEED
jgi:hypothetical protein